MYLHEARQSNFNRDLRDSMLGDVGPGHMLWFPLLLRFKLRGFATKPEFLKQYIELMLAERVGTTEEFRKAFCQADHAEFEFKAQTTANAKPIKFYAADVWGLSFIYSHFPNERPLLHGIQKRGWYLQFNGRSIPQPPFALCKKVFVSSGLDDLMKSLLFEILEDKTGLKREELERLIKKEMEQK